MSPSINASHLDTVITEEINAAADDRWRRHDAGISPAPQTKPGGQPKPKPAEPKPESEPPKPKPAKKSQPRLIATQAPPTPAPRAKKPASSGSAQQTPAPELPPGSMILSASELEVVDLAVDWFVKTHPDAQSK